mgnify:CR=1 FL=1
MGLGPLILGIETSCDETSASLLRGRHALSNVISSQIAIHEEYGGVVPEIASRKHIEAIDWVVQQALEEADVSLSQVDAVAVTAGPGLVGALLVGVSYAKALAYALGVPLVPVHHIEGHIAANYIAHPTLQPPFVALVASGGHSHIVYAKGEMEFEILGQTIDDAAGEAFDKVARVLGLSYPGGVKIDALSKQGNPHAYPLPKAKVPGYNFSFSGVKTAVINLIHNAEQSGKSIHRADMAASFQESVVQVLREHTVAAAKEKGVQQICLAGGVSANSRLRELFDEERDCFQIYYPPLDLCTDNAAMIACAGNILLKQGVRGSLDLNAYPSVKLGERIV